jgi:hypothetical protein
MTSSASPTAGEVKEEGEEGRGIWKDLERLDIRTQNKHSTQAHIRSSGHHHGLEQGHWELGRMLH